MRIAFIIPFVITALAAILYFSDRYDYQINGDKIAMYQCKESKTTPNLDAFFEENLLSFINSTILNIKDEELEDYLYDFLKYAKQGFFTYDKTNLGNFLQLLNTVLIYSILII